MNLEGLRRATISPKDLCEVILKANVIMRSRVRERRTHGSVRGLRREPLVCSTAVIRELWDVRGNYGRTDVNDEYWQRNGEKAGFRWH